MKPGNALVGALGLWGLAALVGCGIGTDPSLQGDEDAAVKTLDAAGSLDGALASDASPVVPQNIPPIDRMTYEETAIASFALG